MIHIEYNHEPSNYIWVVDLGTVFGVSASVRSRGSGRSPDFRNASWRAVSCVISGAPGVWGPFGNDRGAGLIPSTISLSSLGMGVLGTDACSCNLPGSSLSNSSFAQS